MTATVTRADVYAACEAKGLDRFYANVNLRHDAFVKAAEAEAVAAARTAYPPLRLDPVAAAARAAASAAFFATPYETAVTAADELLADMLDKRVAELSLTDPWVAERVAAIVAA